MKCFFRAMCLPIVAAMGASFASATDIGEKVGDFRLFDVDGKLRQLYAMQDKKVIVLMTQGNGCPIVRLAIPALRTIRDTYRARGVEVFLINPNPQDNRDTITHESKDFGFELPILVDAKQEVSETLGVQRTAEVFVIDTKTWKLAFHGPIDDRLNYEAQRPVGNHYLTDALDAVLAGKPVKKAEVISPGCLINFETRR